MTKPTFAERFCTDRAMTREEMAREIFRRSLYPHARLLKMFLIFQNAIHVQADYDLIYAAMDIHRVRDFAVLGAEFNVHPANHGTLRRKWRMRISTKRLRRLLKETLTHEETPHDTREPDGTAVPFNPPAEDHAPRRKSFTGIDPVGTPM